MMFSSNIPTLPKSPGDLHDKVTVSGDDQRIGGIYGLVHSTLDYLNHGYFPDNLVHFAADVSLTSDKELVVKFGDPKKEYRVKLPPVGYYLDDSEALHDPEEGLLFVHLKKFNVATYVSRMRQKAEGTSKSSCGADEEASASITSTSLTDGALTHKKREELLD